MKLRNLNALLFSVAALITISSCGETTKPVSEFKINFNSNGGTSVETITANASSKIEAPANPTRNGYDFVGWYTDKNFENKFTFSYMPDEDTNLYAKWSLKIFSINYDLGLGENSVANPTVYNVTQSDIILEDPTRDGYFFAGWYTDSSYTNKITTIQTSSTSNYDIYAKWSKNEVIVDYTITYHLNGGVNGNNPSSFNKNDTNFQLSPATRDGYTFAGWYLDVSLQESVISIDTTSTKNFDVYAKWTQDIVTPVVNTYSITYYLDGGTNGSNPVRYTDEMSSIELASPKKTSCTFKGWYLDPDFNTPVSAIDCSLKKDISLYAKWVNGINEVTYDLDLGIGKDIVLYHVSDAHINDGTSASDKKAENSWITATRYDFANSFGEKYDKKYLATSSTENFKNIVNYINSEKPDAVCYSGDLMDFYSQANYAFIDREIAKTESPYVYALGNHEDPSSNYANMAGIDTTAFTVKDFGDYEIVCMDNSTKDSSSGTYTFTEEEYNLLKAETDKNKPIILVEHVPILTSYNCESRIEQCGSYFFIDESACDSSSKKVIDLICDNPNIKLILSGHIHGGTMSYVAPNKPLITCSSSLIGTINKITIH